MKEEKHKINKGKKNKFFENDFILFFLGPPVFFIIVCFTGYQIFIAGTPVMKKEKEQFGYFQQGQFFTL